MIQTTIPEVARSNYALYAFPRCNVSFALIASFQQALLPCDQTSSFCLKFIAPAYFSSYIIRFSNNPNYSIRQNTRLSLPEAETNFGKNTLLLTERKVLMCKIDFNAGLIFLRIFLVT